MRVLYGFCTVSFDSRVLRAGFGSFSRRVGGFRKVLRLSKGSKKDSECHEFLLQQGCGLQECLE